MSTASTKADTVIRNANVITMDRNQPRAQAVAMSDGRIVGVGSNRDVETFIGPGVKVMDLTGKHGFTWVYRRPYPRAEQRHTARDGRRLRSALHIRDTDGPAGYGRRPRRRASGCRASSSTTPRRRRTASFSVEELDAVSAFHPIMVSHRAGHIYYLNSMALELAGFRPRHSLTLSAADWAATRTLGS